MLFVAMLLQRTIRKPLVTAGAGFNVYHYGVNSANGASGTIWGMIDITYKQGSSPPSLTMLFSGQDTAITSPGSGLIWLGWLTWVKNTQSQVEHGKQGRCK
jgi:hypothetical protein